MDKPKKPKRIKTTLYIDEELWKRTKIEAIKRGEDATTLVVWALENFLKKGERQ